MRRPPPLVTTSRALSPVAAFGVSCAARTASLPDLDRVLAWVKAAALRGVLAGR